MGALGTMGETAPLRSLLNNTCDEHYTQAQCITIHHGSLEMIFVHNQSGTGYCLVCLRWQENSIISLVHVLASFGWSHVRYKELSKRRTKFLSRTGSHLLCFSARVSELEIELPTLTGHGISYLIDDQMLLCYPLRVKTIYSFT